MDKIRKVLIVIMAIALVLGIAACSTTDVDTSTTGTASTDLTPSDITQLADLINYSIKSSYYEPATVSYGTESISSEEEKLATRITEKKDDEDYDNFSSIVKVFANSDAASIIDAMSLAALPEAKMIEVVDYLAGESTVTESDIEAKVESGTYSATTGWSFFDDYDYYEKLQDKVDASDSTDTDEDNLKRQYRNMAGKIFEIGMSGDEFARLVVYEIEYSITVIESDDMSASSFISNPTDVDSDPFWEYCKTELDYDTLAYLLAFSDYSGTDTGLADTVRLYGYYYDYEKNSYDQTSEDEFEKGLQYGHQTTFTTAEWLDYVDIQRDAYINTYRYSDDFYEDNFYAVHLAFQEIKETRENTVYGITQHNNTSYTTEMRSGMQNGGFAGQLKMSDWLWCYSGNDTNMTSYNDANTLYETGKEQGSENEAEGEFYYDQEQLKITDYLLENMTNIELGCALRYQVYNYSSDMISSIQSNKKDIALLEVDKTAPDDYIMDYGYATTLEEAKEYQIGKTEAFNDQMAISLANASVSTKATTAASESWATMQEEVEVALDDDSYSALTTYVDKLERLEDLVIKRMWSDGSELDDYSTSNHAEDTKVYDTSHAISQFADKYADILRHVGGQSVITFKYVPSLQYDLTDAEETDTYYAPEYYAISSNAIDGTEYEYLTSAMLIADTSYSDYEEYTIESGYGIEEGLTEAGSDESNFWSGNLSKPAKTETSDIGEKDSGSNITTMYTYTYEFVGWYLDADLLYKLEDTDIITCDLNLYAGYMVKKN
jgi:hypothetical protein